MRSRNFVNLNVLSISYSFQHLSLCLRIKALSQLNEERYVACTAYLHVAPGCNAALVDAAGQVDQLAVVVLQAVCAEGFVHTLAPQWHGQALVEGQQAQQKDTQQLDTENNWTDFSVSYLEMPSVCLFVLSVYIKVC